MALPSQKQIDKFKKRIEELKKKDTGINEKEACNIIRSAVRKVWMRHPIKLLRIDLNTVIDDDPSTRTIWKVKCDRCLDFFKKNEVEVDHIKGEHSLKEIEDMVPFVLSILDVTTKDLQVLCFHCHRIKTYSERYGVTEKEAEEILKAKDWMKGNKVNKQKDFFKELGYSEKEYSNADKRLKLTLENIEKL